MDATEALNFNFLDPKTTIIDPAPDGTLRVVVPNDRCGLNIQTMSAFPLSHPDGFVVLRDGAGGELGVFRDLNELPAATRDLLKRELRRRYFLPQITRIDSVSERFGSSLWEIETDRGHVTITTRQMNEAVTEIEPGRYFIKDIEDNRYEIRNLSALDEGSRARFQGKI